ncbi:MAG: homoserine dehydrogenase [Firmicutes bacterium]|nr:homoserine dehydrogenase [Bacillota bacterium]
MKIAILGMGNIGGGVVDVIMKNAAGIEGACGQPIEIKYILDLREFPEHPLGDRIVHDINIIANDPEVSLAAEMMGGSHPAYDFSLLLLEHGKSVVTSNKEVVAKFGCELTRAADASGVHYLYEASVGGGIPLIRPIKDCLASETITAIDGIVNGTTNYILSSIAKSGREFDEVLAEAKALGYAEPNPSADIDGVDAERKITILTALMTGRLYTPEKICTESIRGVSLSDIKAADAVGGTIKLIAHSSVSDGKSDIFAAPCFVPYSSPLAHIDGVYNSVLVNASVSGQLMFFGSGAGRYPTAGSIVADIIAVANGTQRRAVPFEKADDSTILSPDEHISSHFYRVPEALAGTSEFSGAVCAKTGSFAGIITPPEAHEAAIMRAKSLGGDVSVYRVI